MPDPKYLPRRFARIPSSFGRVRAYVQWVNETPRDSELTGELWAVRLRSAQLQHEYAVKIRKGLASRGVTVHEFASAAGMTSARALRMLRGAVVMHLDDIAAGDTFLGRVSEFDIEDGRATPNAAQSLHGPALGNAPERLRIGAVTKVGQPRRQYSRTY